MGVSLTGFADDAGVDCSLCRRLVGGGGRIVKHWLNVYKLS